jgi:hypothetical protein
MRRFALIILILSLLVPGISFAKRVKYEIVEVKNGGTIKGKVKAVTKVDDPILRIDKDTDFCGTSQKALMYLLSPSLEVKNVLVIVEDVTKGEAPPKIDLVIDNKKCYFEPLVGIAYVGSKFVMKNSDPILHNTNLGLIKKKRGKIRRRTLYNLAFPPEKKLLIKKPVRIDGLIDVHCDAHPWMRAHIYSSRHPYVAITDANGNFEIKDLLPGKYTVLFWHEGFKEVRKKVKVEAGKVTELNVTLKR